MKKSIFFLATALSMNAFAQDSQSLADRQYQISNKSEVAKCHSIVNCRQKMCDILEIFASKRVSRMPQSSIMIMDSVLKWKWDTLTNAWEINPYEKAINYIYNTNNNNTSYLFQSWNNIINTWVNSYLLTYTYDSNNNMTSDLSQL